MSGLSCGKIALDIWLKTRARANLENGFTVVIVVHDAGRVVGYYCLYLVLLSPLGLRCRNWGEYHPTRAAKLKICAADWEELACNRK